MMHALVLALACCSVTGHVRAADGRPVDHARVVLAAATSTERSSKRDGTFAFDVKPGIYRLVVTALGFTTTAIDDVVIRGADTLDVTLEPLDGGRLRQIGSVMVDGRLAVARAPVPTRTLSRADLDTLGAQNAIEALGNIPSLTTAHPNGGSSAAPAVVALRGPDPSETRVAFDGQILNDTNTGDVDLARIPTAILSGLDVSEGLGPSDTGGANTIGGEIDLRALQPTARAMRLVRLSAGSFGATSAEINATGSLEKFGYAVALSRAGESGYTHDYLARIVGTPTPLGSAVLGSAALVNLAYHPSERVSLRVRTLTLDNVRDLSASVNAPDPTSSSGAFSGPGPETRDQSIRATLADVSMPFGAGTLTASFANSSMGIAIVGVGASSPYATSYVDRIGTGTLEWARSLGSFDFSLGGYVRGESLDSPDQLTAPQSERSYAYTVRTGTDIGPHVHVSASVSDSRYSTFGTSIDSRIGVRYTMGNGGALRFAFGTGFRAPLLTERFTLPLALLVPDVNCVGVNGNPNLRPEHAAEDELGYSDRIGSTTTFDAALYRTSLHDPIENYYPLGTTCGAAKVSVAQTFPINVGNVVYQGMALALAHRFGGLFARLEYGVNAAYPTALPAFVANATSNANLVVGQQFGGIPLQTLAFDLRYAHSGFHAASNLTEKSANNELAQGRFAVLDGAIGRSWGNLDLTLAGENLTNAVSGRFTRIGTGVPYMTLAGPAPTNAFVLNPASVRLILSIR